MAEQPKLHAKSLLAMHSAAVEHKAEAFCSVITRCTRQLRDPRTSSVQTTHRWWNMTLTFLQILTTELTKFGLHLC